MSTRFSTGTFLAYVTFSLMPSRTTKRSPLTAPTKPLLALGLEGSANKLGIGIVQHLPNGETNILSNVRHTYITPPGEGFLPRDTAHHHREWIIQVLKDACKAAAIGLKDIDCICYTKGNANRAAEMRSGLMESSQPGPGMGAPLQSVALVSRTLALLYDKPIISVNHCVGRQYLRSANLA